MSFKAELPMSYPRPAAGGRTPRTRPQTVTQELPTPFAPKRPKRESFSDASLRALKPATRAEVRYEVMDEGTKHEKYTGLGVRVSWTGRKTFFMLYRREGKLKRYTIGTETRHELDPFARRDVETYREPR